MKQVYSTFLSVVFVFHDQAEMLQSILSETTSRLGEIASDFELVVIDNGSTDDSVLHLKGLTAEGGLPNLQVYALTKEVDDDTAAWVGVENALGDFVAVVDPTVDDIAFLPAMLEEAAKGADVVFATNQHRARDQLNYRIGAWLFNKLYEGFNGVHLSRDAPSYRILSKRVVNFILQHPMPASAYRHLPATAGFARASLTYCSDVSRQGRRRRFVESVDRGMQFIVSTTRAPMRAVTWLSLFGAVSNLFYSGYVIAIAMTRSDVAPGWITLSLQQSGMFLLISLVLFVLGEYILHMATLGNEAPRYHVAQEFTSARLTRRERLNLEVIQVEPTVVANIAEPGSH